MKKMLVVILLMSFLLPFFNVTELYASVKIEAPSVILMEANTRRVLFEENADEARHPASVTKIMTLLLVVEALKEGKIKIDDMVTVSDNAAKMGGSQIFLEVGEQMSVSDMIKSVVVCSANDAAVALAEFVAGSEEAFVVKMNERAAELEMKNTHFENTNGLDDTTTAHLTSARDIALMSAELLSHEMIFEYTTIWQDTVRNGEFTLTNTNKLIRFYNGANGLKTGFTSKSGYCVSATAKRNDMQLISVIMGAETSDLRNITAKRLLDYGFANYAYVEYPTSEGNPIQVTGGVKNSCKIGYDGFEQVVDKADAEKVDIVYEIPQKIAAPVKKGDVIGKVIYKINDKVIAEEDVYAIEMVEKMTYMKSLAKILKKYFMI